MDINDKLIDSATETMRGLVDNVIKVDFDDIESYDFPQDEPFGLQIVHHNELYCFIIRFSSVNKNFICMGPGAYRRDKKTSDGKCQSPPFLVRWRWYAYFEESTIAYADPVMFHKDDINLTWFSGNKDHWPLEDVASIIEKLAINQEVINDNILFFGSSGGGFVSVMLGALVKRSKVLVNNPQLFVLNYYKNHVNALFELLCEEFEGLSREEIENKIKYRLDAIELFKRENYAPPITSYVNIKSSNDVNLQEVPFIQQYHEFDTPNTFNVVYYHDSTLEKPHDPLPTPETVEIIDDYCKNYLYNSDETINDDEGCVLNKRKYNSLLSDKISELNSNIPLLNDRISELDVENIRLKSKVNSFRNSNNSLKNEIEYKKKNIKKLERENRQLRRRRNQLLSSKSHKLSVRYQKVMSKLRRKN